MDNVDRYSYATVTDRLSETFTQEEIYRRFTIPLLDVNQSLVADVRRERRRLLHLQQQLNDLVNVASRVTTATLFRVSNVEYQQRQIASSSTEHPRPTPDWLLFARESLAGQSTNMPESTLAPPGPFFSNLDSGNPNLAPPDLLRSIHSVGVSNLVPLITPRLLLSYLRRPNQRERMPRPLAIMQTTQNSFMIGFRSADAARIATSVFHGKDLFSFKGLRAKSESLVLPQGACFPYRWDAISDEARESWLAKRELPVARWMEREKVTRQKHATFNKEKRRIRRELRKGDLAARKKQKRAKKRWEEKTSRQVVQPPRFEYRARASTSAPAQYPQPPRQYNQATYSHQSGFNSSVASYTSGQNPSGSTMQQAFEGRRHDFGHGKYEESHDQEDYDEDEYYRDEYEEDGYDQEEYEEGYDCGGCEEEYWEEEGYDQAGYPTRDYGHGGYGHERDGNNYYNRGRECW